MKILVISHEYPPIGGGGGRVVRGICEGLANRGHPIHILTAHYADLPRREDCENLIIERLPSGRMEAYRAGFRTMRVFVQKSIGRGCGIIKSWNPDLIHAHFAVPAGVTAFALSSIYRIPYILTAHGGDVPGGAPEKTAGWFRYILPFSKLIWKHARAVTAVSSDTQRLAKEHYPVEIKVIPNGIRTKEYQPGKFDRDTPPEILYIGRFSPEKNAVAVPKILKRLTDLAWHCTMIGDGTQMERVKSIIKQNQLKDRFTLTGWISPEDVKRYMSQSDILFLPSLREGMPMAGLEGLAMGLALVLPEIGSCPDLVKEGKNGFLVQTGNDNGYKKALRTLINEPDLLKEFRAESRKWADQFELDKSIESYEELFREVLEKPVHP